MNWYFYTKMASDDDIWASFELPGIAVGTPRSKRSHYYKVILSRHTEINYLLFFIQPSFYFV